jgi:site-specific recombinase XerD
MGVRLHDLRHSFASTAVTQGTSLAVIAALLGHASISTAGRYAHLADDPVRSASNLTGSRVGRALEAWNEIEESEQAAE